MKGRLTEAKKTFQKIGRVNGHQFDDIFAEVSECEEKENGPGLTDLFKNGNIRKNTLAVLIIW